MNRAASPSLEPERLLLLRKKNRAFVDGTTRQTAGETEARWRVRMVILAAALFCSPLLFLSVTAALHADRLEKQGKTASAVVVETRMTNDPESGTLCWVKYQYSVDSRAFERETEVSNRICKDFAVGQTAEILYLPDDPSISNLELAIRVPKYPWWLAVVCCLFAAAVLRTEVVKLRRQSDLASHGVILVGRILGISSNENGADPSVEVRYAFCVPNGREIQSVARASRKNSNLTDPSPLFPSRYDSVAVLYVSDTVFGLL